MKVALLILLALAVGAASWQHLRYLGVRRDAALDRQPLLYTGDTFHLVVFLRTEDDTDAAAIGALRELSEATTPIEGLEWIYAGWVVANGGASEQLGPAAWTACALLQLHSREDADKALAGGLGAALARFPEVYVHGLDRPVATNLLLPQMLGLRRLASIARREPSSFPFAPREGEFALPEAAQLGERILRGESVTRDAVVIFNLIRAGSREQQERDAAYVGRMMAAMAEGGYGPIHMGRAVRVAGEAEFDNVAIVFYPGVRFFSEMIQSDFFQGIIGDKQLGDTQSTVTVPVLDRL